MSSNSLPVSKWFSAIHRPESRGVPVQLRLFCFPHAGSSTVVFNTRWAKSFPPAVQPIGINYPGRGSRFDEKAYESIKEMITKMVEEVAYCFDRPYYTPYIVFGHSHGSCCALEFVRQLRNKGLTLPMILICTGRLPPQLGIVDTPIAHLPESELQQKMLERYNSPIITDEELKSIAIPPLRADLKALDGYLPDPYTAADPPLPIPLFVGAGDNDKMVPFEKLDLWKEHTTKSFSKTKFPGVGHFFYDNDRFLSFLKGKLESSLEDIEEQGASLTEPHPSKVIPATSSPLYANPSPKSSPSPSASLPGKSVSSNPSPKQPDLNDLEAFDLC